MSAELLATAYRLVDLRLGKPSQSDLKRAISTAYYALFHAVARQAADSLIGATARQEDRAWSQTYRALEHGAARNACGQLATLGFPAAVCDAGNAFVQLQIARHSADYDPGSRFTESEALAAITLAETAIAKLDAALRKDRKALAVQLLLKRR